MRVPSPATSARLTARQLLSKIRREGGRVYRMPDALVFCITNERKLAEWLVAMGGLPYLPAGAVPGSGVGGYKRAHDGPMEWDIYIHRLPVLGTQTIWEAAEGRATDWEVGDDIEAA